MIYTVLTIRPAITNISISFSLFVFVANDKQNKGFYTIWAR